MTLMVTGRPARALLTTRCMREILEPLRRVAKEGVVMTSGDGLQRRCHPILAAFVGDYPEQILVTGVKYGLCPKGKLERTKFGTQEACQRYDYSHLCRWIKQR